jgi:hypothetical protein
MRIINFPTAPEWAQTVQLEGVSYTLRARWNFIAERWSLDILTRDQRLIVGGIRLVRGLRLLRQYADPRLPPGELVILGREGATDGGFGVEALSGQDSVLAYISAAEVAELTGAV